MLAVIVDGVFRVGFDVWAVWLCLLVATKDHVSRNADKCRVIAGRKRGCIDSLAVIQKPAAGGVAFAGLECTVSTCVNDCAKTVFLEKLAQAFGLFGIYAEDIFAKNARVFNRPDANNARHVLANGHAAVQFIEMPKKRKAWNAVQPEN